jgi:two-component system, chemotaxis family, protein-glutamate methylesterase/glutaminase
LSEIVRVLVIDDSAYVRKTLSAILARSPFVEVVGTARDGAEGLELVSEVQPHVITCDLNMPVMDGIAFVREQMSRGPIPIVIVSIAAESGEQALAALDAGAVDFVQKPTALATEKLAELAEELVSKVKAAARARPRVLPLQLAPVAPDVLPATVPRTAADIDIVVMGISTGGPQGLKLVIPRLPKSLPVPIAMVLHMPVGYTRAYAEKLGDLSQLRVIEAQDGDEIVPGTAYLAPAGRHLVFRRTAGRVLAELTLRPLDTPHRPAVDVLFQSAAEVYDGRVLGVVMTGMGSDGRDGAAWIKARGGSILAESEETCVVYGMPRSVVEAGLADAVVPLDRMAAAILERL